MKSRESPKDEAARAQGLAPAHLMPKMKPGAVFVVPDKVIGLPESRIPGAAKRDLHDVRPVIIVQAVRRNKPRELKTVLVVPCSASRSGAATGDVDIPDEAMSGFWKERVVAYTTLLQPVLKGELLEHRGDVSAGTLEALQVAIMQNLGLEQDEKTDLPPR